jgi:hypothetical protein
MKEQLWRGNEIDEYILPKLQGKSLYGAYAVGDKILTFLEQTFVIEHSSDVIVPTFNVRTITDRHLPELEMDYTYVGMQGSLPILVKKEYM